MTISPMRFVILGLALAAGGCGSQPSRSKDQIFTEKMNLPQVFLGLKTGKKVVAPMSKGAFIDDATKDEFLPAMECRNPDCPSRQGNDPVLFVLPRGEPQRGCPACLKRRDRKSESPEERAKYESFVLPYVLPETKARAQQLDEEFQRAAQSSRK